MSKENKQQKRFRLEMNDLLSTPTEKKHVFETKNFYKDYPCDCGARDNSQGKTCWRYKANKIKEEFYEILSDGISNIEEV